jgi:hypothetical protein
MSAARGSVYTWSAETRNGSGILAAAPDLTLAISDPNGDVLAGFPIDLTIIVTDGTGLYHFDWTVPIGADLGTYEAAWAGTISGLAVGGTDSVEVTDVGPITSTFVSLLDVRALVSCKQTDPQLQAIIAREEGWLADRIGPLTGVRTQTFYLPAEREQFYIEPSGYALDRPRLPYPYMIRDVDAESPITLFRQAESVSLATDGGATVTTRLLSMGWKVEKTTGPWLGPTMAVTYTPTDGGSVTKVVIELVRMTVFETGFIQERIGDYMYSRRAGNIEPVAANEVARMALVRTLLYPTNIPRTMRLRSSGLSDRIGAPTP